FCRVRFIERGESRGASAVFVGGPVRRDGREPRQGARLGCRLLQLSRSLQSPRALLRRRFADWRDDGLLSGRRNDPAWLDLPGTSHLIIVGTHRLQRAPLMVGERVRGIAMLGAEDARRARMTNGRARGFVLDPITQA